MDWLWRLDANGAMPVGEKRKFSAREDVSSDAVAPQDAELPAQLRRCLFYATVDKFRKECVAKRPNLHRHVLICNTLHQIREEMCLEKSLLPGLNPPALTHPPPVQAEVTPQSLAREVTSWFKAASQPPKGPGDAETAGLNFSAASAVPAILEPLEPARDPGGPQDSLADPRPAVEEAELARVFGDGSSQSHRQPDAGESHGLATTGSRCAAEELHRGSPGDAAANLSLGTALGEAWPQAELLLASAEFAKPADSFFGSFEILDSGYLSDLAGDDLFSDIDTSGFESFGADVPSSRQPSQASGDPAAPCNTAGRDWHDLDHLMEIVVGS
ncbi:SERTA domain-containing protein 2-like [Emys orbicularis]|uniref:SERTA domain-containing protein 2-like n=1 Tax=Emys orbicularis TaxID=82168 RepID=UPI0031FD3A98